MKSKRLILLIPILALVFSCAPQKSGDSSETRMSGTVGNYKNGTAVDGKNVWDNLNIPAGHFGIFDWGDTGSTFEILEYRDL